MSEPRNPFAGMTDDEIERELAGLRTRIAFPATPDLARAVRGAIAEEPVGAEVRQFPLRKVLAAAAIVVFALVAGLLLSGGFRSTVADFFGVRGVRIVIERETPTPTATTAPARTPVGTPIATPVASPRAEATPIGTGLLLGQRVTLAEAQAAVSYRVQVPGLASLGEPDEVYLRTLPEGNRMVSFVYFPETGLPEALETGVGALLMQFEARDRVEYLGKEVGEGNAWVRTDVDGRLALWIEGAHELTLLQDPSRGCCEESDRLAGNVLLWEEDGVTFRLESALEMEEAIEIAESVSVPRATPAARQSGN